MHSLEENEFQKRNMLLAIAMPFSVCDFQIECFNLDFRLKVGASWKKSLFYSKRKFLEFGEHGPVVASAP